MLRFEVGFAVQIHWTISSLDASQ